jgi:membrane protein implicated in regulation of membrane protease activity
MTWAHFYLVCFAVGFFLSVLMFLAGGLNLHLPHIHIHFPGAHGHVSGGHAGGMHGAGGAHGSGRVQHSPINPMTLTAFLAWFGGTGFLLMRHSTIWFVTALIIALFAGAGGAAIIYLFLSKVLTSEDEALDPADFEMVGVLGKLSVRIREGGTGEMIYSQAGTRRVCGARSDLGGSMLKGTEVVVTRYQNGIAYVRRWSEMSGEDAELDGTSRTKGANEARPQ